MLHALLLFADALGEEKVLEGEVQEDVLEEVEALDLERGGGSAGYQESGRGHQVARALFQNRVTRLNDEVSRVCCFALRGLGGLDLQNRSANGFMNGPETMRATAIFLSAGGPFGIMVSGFTMVGS